MINVLVTGARGFVGKNLCLALRRREEVSLVAYDLENTSDDLRLALSQADMVFHLAGINRPMDDAEYTSGNAGFTHEICAILESLHRAPKIVLTSSTQAELDNPYGTSKRGAEEVLREFAAHTGAVCVVYRLTNLFGKWCRPNYNSVTATFCYNIAHDLPIEISNPSRHLDLTYIDDVVAAFIQELSDGKTGFRYAEPLRAYRVTLGELAQTVRTFHAIRKSLRLPDFANPFIRNLYATYVSYLDGADCGYTLDIKIDQRGSLAEFIKGEGFGQIFVSRTNPGITRGNHYHHTKTEKFLVVQGQAVIRLRHIHGDELIEHRVRGEDYRVVDIPPGFIHSITNVGQDEVVTLFWADEVFDPGRPDTFYEEI